MNGRPNSTHNIVQYLIIKYQEITGNSLIGDEMKVHKLMYYAQKTSIALTGNSIIDEEFEGWVHGPVLPSLRGLFEYFVEDSNSIDDINDTEEYIIENTIYQYGKYATWALRDKSHKEISWIKSREGLKPNERGFKTLSIEDIKKDASKIRLYDYKYDMYLDEFDDFDEEEFVSVF
ncbi:Panacea domain-containing protein [Staphylococcus simulans]|uniref:Panacea domain-containing protein n=1 Tax=Staphylococcus simulans TaxID=1286 RepID=UPI000F70E8F1|nr:type II toxin-antitoxin system antitoxin SocA domain-containing protein [Staphylococcus simulans]VED60384.1 phage protein [Staphylococcus simulans]